MLFICQKDILEKPVKGSKYGTDIFKAQAGVDLPKLQIRFQK
jgi:hypothetical protein